MEPIASGVPVGWAPPAAVVAEDPDPDVPVEPVVVGVLLFVELEPHAAATTAKPHNKAGNRPRELTSFMKETPRLASIPPPGTDRRL
jgi:hypothetical protein